MTKGAGFARLRSIVALAALLTGGACGDDDGATDGGGGTDSGSARDSGVGTDAGGGVPPVIRRVDWEPQVGCSIGSDSDFTITLTVEDPDTAAANLTFSGRVPNCPGMLDASVSTVNCPNLAPYIGTVTVEDPERNSDTATFTFGPCESGGTSF